MNQSSSGRSKRVSAIWCSSSCVAANGEPVDPRALLRFSYASRGRYAEQLERWFERFPRERFLIVGSDELYSNPAETFERIVVFLGLRRWLPRTFENHSYDKRTRPEHEEMPTATRRALEIAFAKPDAQLRELLGRDLWWDR